MITSPLLVRIWMDVVHVLGMLEAYHMIQSGVLTLIQDDHLALASCLCSNFRGAKLSRLMMRPRWAPASSYVRDM